ncbi:hypothetical protein [Lacunimicrobium album]
MTHISRPKDPRRQTDTSEIEKDALPKQDDILDETTNTDIATGSEGGGPALGYGKPVSEERNTENNPDKT